MTRPPSPASRQDRAPDGSALHRTAEAYVRLVLALGVHDPDYVDAYHGPADWCRQAEADPPPPREIARRAEGLLAQLPPAAGEVPKVRDAPLPDPLGGPAALEAIRGRLLRRLLAALATRARMVAGDVLPFDREAELLYDVAPEVVTEERLRAALRRLERRLAQAGFAGGSLGERMTGFREGFRVAPKHLGEAFLTALEEARSRTAAHLDLPAAERFEVEWVEGEPWSAYNWYQGSATSLIQVNRGLPVAVHRLVELACHEGYPGHHAHNALQEHHLLRGSGWVEISVYPLFSPLALVSEGVATLASEVAFPGRERVTFEQEEIFPRVGLDPARAPAMHRVLEAMEELSVAGPEAARRHLDGRLDPEEAADWLTRHSTMTAERARRAVAFHRRYRSYVVTYTDGKRRVRDWLRSHQGDDWHLFGRLLRAPALPSDLG